MDTELRTQVRSARKNFVAMASAYSLGVFNDNFFRRSVVVLAILGGAIAEGWVLVIFALPYVLFAWVAGWLADRFSKHRVVVLAKALELAAMTLGAVALLTGNWPLLLSMVFLMALQSCLFGPSLNGSIPELFPAEYVHRANSLLNLAVKPMILGGYVLGGIALGVSGSAGGVEIGRWIAAGVIVGVSLVGLGVSIGAPRRPAANSSAKFPWHGPVHTIRELVELRRDPLLAIAAAADVFVWAAGAMVLILIDVLALEARQNWGETLASVLMAAQLVGLAAGGFLSSYVAAGRRWYRALAPSAAAFGLVLVGVGFLPSLPEPWRFLVAFVLLGLTGLFGGLFMIPVEAFIQVRAPAAKRGTVLASVAFAIFAAIMLAGGLEMVLIEVLTFATRALAAVGLMALAMACWLRWKLRDAARWRPIL